MTSLKVALIILMSTTVAAAQEDDRADSTAIVGGALTPQEQENVALVMRLYEESWNSDNYAVADELFSDDYIRHDNSAPVQGPGNAIPQSERARQMKALVSDIDLKPDVILADGNLVAVRWTTSVSFAGFPAFLRSVVGKSGPSVTTGVNVFRIENGRIVEVWNNRDDLATMGDIGMFRWLFIGGLAAGVIVTCLLSWSARRWRTFRSRSRAVAATPGTAI